MWILKEILVVAALPTSIDVQSKPHNTGKESNIIAGVTSKWDIREVV